jgi:hypothetical protein
MTSLREQVGQHFKARFRGELYAPGDQGYDDARKVYNAMIDKRPGLVARCAGVTDVRAAVGPRAGSWMDPCGAGWRP